MPKEMHLAARNNRGDELLYHENPYPPVSVVELFEKYSPGSAKVLLDMAKTDQENSFEIANRASKVNAVRVWFGFLLTCREGVDREKVVRYLEAKGVQTRMLFAGNLIKHPCFDQLRASGKGYRVIGSLDNTDRIMKDTFWVGVYPGMTDEMIDYMSHCMLEYLN